jgi:DNA modification methylase
MSIHILEGDCRVVMAALPEQSAHCIVTSPPYYGLRDYCVDGQIGLELTPNAYVAEMVAVFREARRVLRDDGTLWLNIGDSYSSSRHKTQKLTKYEAAYTSRPDDGAKSKDLLMIPARVALALQADGWYLRSEIIWAKPNPMPESVRDRPTSAHEKVYLFAKQSSYYYDAKAVAEPSVYPPGTRKDAKKGSFNSKYTGGVARIGDESFRAIRETRNLRNVWTIAAEPSSIPHFAMMPTALAELCIKAGCPKNGTVLDPFGGVGTTGLVGDRLGRNAILIELNPESISHCYNRIRQDARLFASFAAE